MSPAIAALGLSAPAPPAAAQPAPAAPSATPAPSPQAQLAPVFAAAAPLAKPGAPQRLVIRLDPGELGHVQVSIERPANGPPHIALAAERPETLALLLADRPQLNTALDAAGLPADGRTLQFSLSSGNGNSGSGSGSGANSGSSNGQPGAGSGGGQRTPLPHRTAWLRAGVDITA